MIKSVKYALAFVYGVLTIAFWIGLFVSLNGIPSDYVPDQNALYCFGVGLTALPALVLGSGAIVFYADLFRSKPE